MDSPRNDEDRVPGKMVNEFRWFRDKTRATDYSAGTLRTTTFVLSPRSERNENYLEGLSVAFRRIARLAYGSRYARDRDRSRIGRCRRSSRSVTIRHRGIVRDELTRSRTTFETMIGR